MNFINRLVNIVKENRNRFFKMYQKVREICSDYNEFERRIFMACRA